ncbi:MAG: hypothetical protein ACR2OZ_21180 [Verrucomicrobiales bacterium]
MNVRSRSTLWAVVLAVSGLTFSVWQQHKIGGLRDQHSQPQAAEVFNSAEMAKLRAEIARLRVHDGAADEVARLREEKAALEAQNAALAQQASQASEAQVIASRHPNGQVNEALLSPVFSHPGGEVAFGTIRYDSFGPSVAGKGAAWGHEQAAGAPDTHEAGDLQTAWASREPDGGTEWLELKYDKPVEVSQINVHETFNPGAVAKITALNPDGTEKVLWEGTEPREEAPVEMSFPVPAGIRSDQIKVYLDTGRVPGWNEIDAVEVVATDGTRQWASSSKASSHYGDNRGAANRLSEVILDASSSAR